MSSVVYIDPMAMREMDRGTGRGRDFLDLDQQPARIGTVVNFTSKLERGTCVACGRSGHRSSKCPNRQQS